MALWQVWHSLTGLQLSGKPASSSLHIHPTTEDTSPKGDQISM